MDLKAELFSKTPIDILQLILQFDGRLKKRNGVYMNQILINDERYKLLRSIPQKEFFGTTLSERRTVFIVNNTIVNETFVYFRNKRDENNKYYTIYFQEHLDPPPYKITHYFTKCFFTNIDSFILP